MMTAEECVDMLVRLGYKAEVNDRGLPTIICPLREMAKRKKYEKIMSLIGWNRSWARRGVKTEK